MSQRKMVIVWSAKDRTSGRSQRIADALGAELRYVYYPTLFGLNMPLPMRYMMQGIATFFILLTVRPAVLTLQLPPVFAAFPVFLVGKLFGTRIHLDFHTSFQDKTWRKFHRLHHFFAKNAAYVTAHNKDDFVLLQRWAPEHSAVLKSPAMDRNELVMNPGYLSALDVNAHAHERKVFFVNRFANDDPYEEVIALARMRPETCFFVTGNPDKVALDLATLPANVVLTGFIHPSKFLALMDACDVVLSLTTRPGTLLWSIREALALGKPVVTSDHSILKEEFGAVALFTNHRPEDLSDKIDKALEENDTLMQAAMSYIEKDKLRWERDVKVLRDALSDSTSEG